MRKDLLIYWLIYIGSLIIIGTSVYGIISLYSYWKDLSKMIVIGIIFFIIVVCGMLSLYSYWKDLSKMFLAGAVIFILIVWMSSGGDH
jgi:hypothetical protein